MKVWVLLPLRFQLRGNPGMEMRQYVPWNSTKSKTTLGYFVTKEKRLEGKDTEMSSELNGDKLI